MLGDLIAIGMLSDLLNEKGKFELDEVPTITIRPLEFDEAEILVDLIGSGNICEDESLCGVYTLLVADQPAVDLMKLLSPHLDARLKAEIDVVLNDFAFMNGIGE